MSSLDGSNIFSSGPHSFRPLAWQRQLQRRSFPGLDGELVLDMGMRSRRIVQQGRLQASSASSLAGLVAAIERFVDAQNDPPSGDRDELILRRLSCFGTDAPKR